ncbi:hypothetical protein [Burkholderia sp. BCC0322]|uniref:hypothetical protein n=1 Tax=unclassified Burkholderia TaxID=2613784 RepID=UPI00158DAAE3|nr:hypothetical protein [Burkholderia sp. BCC0322]
MTTKKEQSPSGCTTPSRTAPIAVRPDRFAPFVADVEVARHAPLLTRADLRGTSMARGR